MRRRRGARGGGAGLLHRRRPAPRLGARLRATKLARAPREAAAGTGRQTLSVLASVVGEPFGAYRRMVLAGDAPGLQPVVVGLAGRALGLARRETVLLLFHLVVAGY